MKVNIGTYSFGGIASYLGLGPTLLEKFQTIKSLGYDGVELLPVDLDNDVEDIKKWAQETGLEIVSIHAKPTEDIVKKMAALGGKAVIWAGTDFCNKEEALALAKELDEMAAMAEPYGIKVGYHNHSKEFFVDEGLPLMEYVLDNSSKCYMQLDCGWAMNAGTYPPSVKELPLEQRQKMLEEFTARNESPEGKKRFEVQCKLGAPESNMDWQEIKNALDEQDLEAFWVVERENFYDDHDKCLAEDCAWLKEHIQ